MLYQFEIVKKHGAGNTPWKLVDVNVTIDGVLTHERIRIDISETRQRLRDSASMEEIAGVAVIDAMAPGKTLNQVNNALPEFNI